MLYARLQRQYSQDLFAIFNVCPVCDTQIYYIYNNLTLKNMNSIFKFNITLNIKYRTQILFIYKYDSMKELYQYWNCSFVFKNNFHDCIIFKTHLIYFFAV